MHIFFRPTAGAEFDRRSLETSVLSDEQKKQSLLNRLVDAWTTEGQRFIELYGKKQQQNEQDSDAFFNQTDFQEIYMQLFDIPSELTQAYSKDCFKFFLDGLNKDSKSTYSPELLAIYSSTYKPRDDTYTDRLLSLNERFGHSFHYTGQQNFFDLRQSNLGMLEKMIKATGASILFCSKELEEDRFDPSNTDHQEKAGKIMIAMAKRLLLIREYMRMSKIIQSDRVLADQKLTSQLKAMEANFDTLLESEKFGAIGAFVKIRCEVLLREEKEYKDTRSLPEIINDSSGVVGPILYTWQEITPDDQAISLISASIRSIASNVIGKASEVGVLCDVGDFYCDHHSPLSLKAHENSLVSQFVEGALDCEALTADEDLQIQLRELLSSSGTSRPRL